MIQGGLDPNEILVRLLHIRNQRGLQQQRMVMRWANG